VCALTINRLRTRSPWTKSVPYTRRRSRRFLDLPTFGLKRRHHKGSRRFHADGVCVLAAVFRSCSPFHSGIQRTSRSVGQYRSSRLGLHRFEAACISERPERRADFLVPCRRLLEDDRRAPKNDFPGSRTLFTWLNPGCPDIRSRNNVVLRNGRATRALGILLARPRVVERAHAARFGYRDLDGKTILRVEDHVDSRLGEPACH